MLFLANLYAKLNITPTYWKELEIVFQAPFTATNHEVLAYNLWKEGRISQAQSELKLSQEFPKANQTSVLGVSTEDELTAWDQEPKQARKTYDYWKNIIAVKPGFRDAYLGLSVAAYALGKVTESKSAVHSALVLDPASITASQLDEFLTNTEK